VIGAWIIHEVNNGAEDHSRQAPQYSRISVLALWIAAFRNQDSICECSLSRPIYQLSILNLDFVSHVLMIGLSLCRHRRGGASEMQGGKESVLPICVLVMDDVGKRRIFTSELSHRLRV